MINSFHIIFCLYKSKVNDKGLSRIFSRIPFAELRYVKLLRTQHRGNVMARDLKNYFGQTVRMICNFVTNKLVHTVKNQTMCFAAWLDNNGICFDIVHFPQSIQFTPFKGRGCYLTKVKVIEEFGFCSHEVERCEITGEGSQG
ncbi:hypothetical protein MUGA111182_17755 [Mucilaginibacter galii]|uniref:hypothetical protein n=1 Tax=Mucilaginibacter galii TaxID=2005073 RepID=UPI003640F280